MSVKLPNTSTIEIAASYGPVTDIDAVSNADPAAATVSSSHGVATGDILEITSGWSRLTDRIVKAGTVAGNIVPLLGINSSNTTRYPVGSGTGTFREVLTWTQLLQILEPTSEGGEQQFLEYQFLEADIQRRLPTVKTAYGLTMQIGDDPDLAGYQLALEANEDQVARAVRITFPDTSLILFNAVLTVNEMPRLTVNELMTVQLTMSLQGNPVRYGVS